MTATFLFQSLEFHHGISMELCRKRKKFKKKMKPRKTLGEAYRESGDNP